MPDSEYEKNSEAISKFSQDKSEYAIDELIRYVHIAYKYRGVDQLNRTKFYNESLDALKNKNQHIQHIKNKIEEYSKGDVAGKQLRLNSYFVVLQQIKSADSVQLLGNYLYDDRNAKPKVNWEPGMDIAPNDSASNSWLAAKALQTMGIKNPPQPDHRGYAIIDSWKLWFEQVKAGNRTFSFEGENIAYRLKKDGTFETLDASAVDALNRQTHVNSAPHKPSATDGNTRKLTWIVFASLLFSLITIYFFKFRKQPS
jgi:hypothetical protein